MEESSSIILPDSFLDDFLTVDLEPEDLPAYKALADAPRKISLYEFLVEAWPIIEPDYEFVPGWHLQAIAEHLEAVESGELRRLLVCIPPRMTKSNLTSICYPAWAWTQRPGRRFIFASYNADLAVETHGITSRRLMQSPWYQEHWGSQFNLIYDQNTKHHFENNKRGFRISSGLTSVTGKGADVLVLDDPHDLEQIDSEVARISVRRFYRKVWRSRLNDPKRGSQVCIMQRAHEDDLADMLMKEYNYEPLILPNEFDPKRICMTSIGWKDPRTEEGELLCPDRYGEEETAVERDKSEYETQYNQNPQPDEGIVFKHDWLQIIPANLAPSRTDRGHRMTVRAWDPAATDPEKEPEATKEPAYTAGVLLSYYDDNRVIIEDVIRARLSPDAVHQTILNTAMADGRKVRIAEEEEGGSAGKTVTYGRKQALLPYGVRYDPRRPTGEKFIRWQPLAQHAEAMKVFLIEGDWNSKFIRELTALPHSKFKDQADAAALALEVALQSRAKIRKRAVTGI